MITKTFSHIDGISPKLEKLLLESGIRQWNDFITQKHLFADLPKTKLEKIENSILASQNALEKNDLHYFKNILKSKEHWRLCKLGKIAYVDIETTGLSRWSDDITIIGVYDGINPYTYVNGINLHEAREKLSEFDILVTFNGKQFDMPFIEHYFSCKYDAVHLDLRYMLKEFGLQGGLKNIEIQLGISRGVELAGVDGFEAVRLWYQYKKGHQNALEKLLRYNEQDIINLKFLLDHYLEKKEGIVS
ncbi:MAG TPA: ribonuclease H-like domain-containing protein [Parachlamydiaceae bacterium]|nr:ribonuclease H-like domain-containing protein [Parachlamydiaceae bacterium]